MTPAVTAEMDQLTEAVRNADPEDLAQYLAASTALLLVSCAVKQAPTEDSVVALLPGGPDGLGRAAVALAAQEVSAELRRRRGKP